MKYLAIEGKWQFVPVLEVKSTPKPARVLIGGEPVQDTEDTFYVDWREDGNAASGPSEARYGKPPTHGGSR